MWEEMNVDSMEIDRVEPGLRCSVYIVVGC